MIDGAGLRYGQPAEKYAHIEFLAGWLRTLTTSDLSYGDQGSLRPLSVDVRALSHAATMAWADLA